MSLPCSAQATNELTIRYRWTRDRRLVGEAERQQGELVIASISADQSDNGLYECSLVVQASSVNAAPLVIPVASSLVTVGGKLS